MTNEREPPSRQEWVHTRERGSALAFRLLMLGFGMLGSRLARVLVPPIAFYFSIFARDARRASIDFQKRVRAASARASETVSTPGWIDAYRHFHSFANVIADRFALWGGGGEDFDLDFHGRARMDRILESGRGGLLLGAHFGSFDILRVVARDEDIPVNVLMYTGNAELINRAFEQLDPGSRMRVIPMDPSPQQTAFAIRACIDRGEFVALLADRTFRSPRDRQREVSFLGSSAAFSMGPFELAHVLDVPIIFTVAVRRGRRAYDLHFEPIGDPRDAPGRSARNAWAEASLARYVARVEALCMRVPLQWFNFYDFWEGANAQ